MLPDAMLGELREVDVVVEGTFDSEKITISFEVVDRGRPISIEWVEQQIAKHQHLPTNQLVLVSWSGFSKRAVRRVEAEGGSVLAATPEPVTNPDGTQQRSRTLQFAELELTPRDIHVTVVRPVVRVAGSRSRPTITSSITTTNT